MPDLPYHDPTLSSQSLHRECVEHCPGLTSRVPLHSSRVCMLWVLQCPAYKWMHPRPRLAPALALSSATSATEAASEGAAGHRLGGRSRLGRLPHLRR